MYIIRENISMRRVYIVQHTENVLTGSADRYLLNIYHMYIPLDTFQYGIHNT